MTEHPDQDYDIAVAAFRVLAPAIAAAGNEVAAIRLVGRHVAELLRAGGRLFTFGAGHSYTFAMELCSRAGGLPNVTAMNLEDLQAEHRPAWHQLHDSAPEREPSNGPLLLDAHLVGPGDAVIIASQSGRNGAIVEMALECQRRRVYVVGCTSVAHSVAVESRHPSGRKLLDVVDQVIDNHTPHGDAVLPTSSGRAICASSTVSFALIAQMLNAELIRELSGGAVPFMPLLSGNIGR